MGIRYLKTYAALEGQVTAEDAETLQHWLLAQPHPKVHLAKCEHMHAAALQVLMALRPALASAAAAPTDPWLAGALGLTPAQAPGPNSR